mgnify:CR=1 FL=1
MSISDKIIAMIKVAATKSSQVIFFIVFKILNHFFVINTKTNSK